MTIGARTLTHTYSRFGKRSVAQLFVKNWLHHRRQDASKPVIAAEITPNGEVFPHDVPMTTDTESTATVIML
eukprot:1450877-Amphidinium_carterae.1